MYTLLSRAKCRNHLKLLNFIGRSQIKVNKAALDEMRRMRTETVLSFEHPIKKMNGSAISLFNIRSWNLHLPHFLSDLFLVSQSSVLLFTETKTGNCPSVKKISDYCVGWDEIHHPSENGLAFCYKVTCVETLPTLGVIQCLPVMMTIDEVRVLLVLIYRPPSQAPITTFAQSLMIELGQLRSHIFEDNNRTILAGDFNMPDNLDVLD